MPTEFEAEREQLATLYDVRLAFLAAKAEGKAEFTIDEILAFLDEIAEKKKRHA